MSITREAVLAALDTVEMPGTGGSIVAPDIVRALTVEGDRVRFVLEVDPAQGAALEPVRAARRRRRSRRSPASPGSRRC